MLLIVGLVLTGANLLLAWRSLHIVVHSRSAIEPCGPGTELPALSVIVPARNEERNVARCVRSLLAMEHSNFEVIVVDDASTDATRSIVSELARNDSRLKLIAGQPLPAGWVGKPWALAQGARAAAGAWLLFTDADTEHQPQAAPSARSCSTGRSATSTSA